MTTDRDRGKPDENATRRTRADAEEPQERARDASPNRQPERDTTGDLGGDGLHRRINNETAEDDDKGRDEDDRRSGGRA